VTFNTTILYYNLHCEKIKGRDFFQHLRECILRGLVVDTPYPHKHACRINIIRLLLFRNGPKTSIRRYNELFHAITLLSLRGIFDAVSISSGNSGSDLENMLAKVGENFIN
jgi:hypothetical protein